MANGHETALRGGSGGGGGGGERETNEPELEPTESSSAGPKGRQPIGEAAKFLRADSYQRRAQRVDAPN